MFMVALGMIRRIGSPRRERLAAAPESVSLCGKIWRRVREEYRYRRALWQLNSLDDRDLDDLALARSDLPALAWRHARTA
jgi:uncharacterized protein YjiS (DUF1127 family)